MEWFVFRRRSQYKYAVKKHVFKKDELLWENYKSSKLRDNNRQLDVEHDKAYTKGKSFSDYVCLKLFFIQQYNNLMM